MLTSRALIKLRLRSGSGRIEGLSSGWAIANGLVLAIRPFPFGFGDSLPLPKYRNLFRHVMAPIV